MHRRVCAHVACTDLDDRKLKRARSPGAEHVMQRVLGDDLPEMSMTSPALPAVTRRLSTLKAYSDEVSNARVRGGIHYRFSTVVGQDMGDRIAELTVKTKLLPAKGPIASGR